MNAKLTLHDLHIMLIKIDSKLDSVAENQKKHEQGDHDRFARMEGDIKSVQKWRYTIVGAIGALQVVVLFIGKLFF